MSTTTEELVERVREALLSYARQGGVIYDEADPGGALDTEDSDG